MKTSKSFRLSVQALSSLQYLADETGANETAILEIALAHYRQAYNSAKLADISEVTGRKFPSSIVERVKIVDSVVSKKKRKRH